MSTSEALLLKGHEKSFRSIKHGLVQATVVALKDDDLSDTLSLEKTPRQTYITQTSAHEFAPRISSIDKMRENFRLLSTRTHLRVITPNQSQALSKQGRFVQCVVEPLHSWYGRNERVLSAPCSPRIHLQGRDGAVVNASSHDYMGCYKEEKETESLQRLCLERLPVTGALPSLEAATHETVTKFFEADFCYITSTGYGANYVALPAIVEQGCAVVLDAKCHNSIFTGVYLSETSCVRKFTHNNMKHLETILNELEGKHESLLVVVEGLYSMDGDLPPLGALYKLKQRFQFTLFCDEAHSFLSIGHTGRGCLEQWNDDHIDSPVPWDLIDIRTATLSKAIGAIGGLICGTSKLKASVEKKLATLQIQEREPLPCFAMIQTLWVLGQPTIAARRLHRLAEISRFCHSELKRFGIHVYGTPGGPILPIHAGRVSTSAKLSFVLRQLGLIAAPISAPAVGLWESRVRVNLSAGHTDEDVNALLAAVIQAAQSIGICPKSRLSRQQYCSPGLPSRSTSEEKEMTETYEEIKESIHRAANCWDINPDRHIHDAQIIEAGHDSRQAYGLCSGSARWIGGTFTQHLAVESLLAKATGTQAGLTYSDSFIGLASTIAALSRPLLGYGNHFMLVQDDVPKCMNEGLRIAPPKRRPVVLRYKDTTKLVELVKQYSQPQHGKRSHLTIILYLPSHSTTNDILSTLLATLSTLSPQIGITLLIYSPSYIFNTSQFPTWPASKKIQTLVCGSFYDTFGLPGGYLAGDERLIRELRYTSRGYMYTTSSAPWLLGMIGVALERGL